MVYYGPSAALTHSWKENKGHGSALKPLAFAQTVKLWSSTVTVFAANENDHISLEFGLHDISNQGTLISKAHCQNFQLTKTSSEEQFGHTVFRIVNERRIVTVNIGLLCRYICPGVLGNIQEV